METQSQRPMKKRCPMCSSSNALTATSCEMCGCSFDASVHPRIVAPSGSVTSQEMTASQPGRSNTRPTSSGHAGTSASSVKAISATSARALQSVPKVSTARKSLVPVAPVGGRHGAKSGDLAALLDSSNATPAKAQRASTQPLLGIWMMISLVVIVGAVLVTAAFFMNSTVVTAVK